MNNLTNLTWYQAYRVAQALENPSITKEAGLADNLSGIALAISLFFGGMDIAEAADRAKVKKHDVELAIKAKQARPENKNVSVEEQIARTLFAEAGAESLAGKKAVASTIWNRAEGDKSRVLSVIKQPKQFSCWNSGMPARGSGKGWEDCIQIAKEMMNGTFTPTTSKSHYYAPKKANPGWAYTKGKGGKKVLRPYEVVGNHHFLDASTEEMEIYS